MTKYSIKQISEKLFIPQVKDSFFLSSWLSIDDHLRTWHGTFYSEKYCICCSSKEAEEIIEKYKNITENKLTKTKYPIYHMP